MGLVKLIGSFILIAIFAIAITSYAVNFGEDNNTSMNLSEDSDMSSIKNLIESNLVDFKGQSNSSSSSFQKSKIESGDDNVATGGFFKTITGPIEAVKSTLSLGNKKIFGSEQGNSQFGIILTVFSSFLVVLWILLIWKTWAGKNPE